MIQFDFYGLTKVFFSILPVGKEVFYEGYSALRKNPGKFSPYLPIYSPVHTANFH
jgi:hypothetical protein